MRREFGFYSPDFEATNVLVRVEPDAPASWRWVVGGREVTVPSHGVLACIADFGMCVVEGIPRLPGRSSAALPPMQFLDSVAALAARHGIDGAFTRAVGAVLAEHVLYKKPHPEAASRTLRPAAVTGRISVPRIFRDARARPLSGAPNERHPFFFFCYLRAIAFSIFGAWGFI
jgi:hypothetical protein